VANNGDTSCQSGVTVSFNKAGCQPVPVPPYSAEVTRTPKLVDAGSCAPDGGAPTGSATPTTPITVCCGP
jgi:hypothetical protein